MEDLTFESIKFGEKSQLKFEWPTKNTTTMSWYSFCGIELSLTQNYMVIERSTYSLLEWLGDVGGPFDGLSLVAQLIIAPFSSFAMRSLLLSQIFLRTPHFNDR